MSVKTFTYMIYRVSKSKTCNGRHYVIGCTVRINNTIASARELHGDGNDGITALTVGLDFMTDTAIIAGMGTAFTVVSR